MTFVLFGKRNKSDVNMFIWTITAEDTYQNFKMSVILSVWPLRSNKHLERTRMKRPYERTVAVMTLAIVLSKSKMRGPRLMKEPPLIVGIEISEKEIVNIDCRVSSLICYYFLSSYMFFSSRLFYDILVSPRLFSYIL